MVRVIVTKASNNEWYELKTFTDIESIFNFVQKNGSVILQGNWHYREDPKEIMEFFEDVNISFEEAEIISKCKYQVMIYDDYIE